MLAQAAKETSLSPEDEQRQLDSARDALVTEFEGRLPADAVADRFAGIVREFEAAPIRGFVPVLAQRKARESLSG